MQRTMMVTVILAATLTLGACDQFKGPKGDKGNTGSAGPAGPAGPTGEKGDPGIRLHIIVSDGSNASCGENEFLVSATCRKAGSNDLVSGSQLSSSGIAAQCGDNADNPNFDVTITCAPK